MKPKSLDFSMRRKPCYSLLPPRSLFRSLVMTYHHFKYFNCVQNHTYRKLFSNFQSRKKEERKENKDKNDQVGSPFVSLLLNCFLFFIPMQSFMDSKIYPKEFYLTIIVTVIQIFVDPHN